MITVTITRTAKSPNPKDFWRKYDESTKNFADMTAARAWVKEAYFYCKKRIPCYVDTKEGTVQTGYIYCYKEREQDRTSYEQRTYYERHWVTFEDVVRTPVDVRGRKVDHV